MMEATHILHFGEDTCHRCAVLRAAGYAVVQCDDLPSLAARLRQSHEGDVICINEQSNQPSESAIALAITSSTAPVLLFRSSQRSYPHRDRLIEIPALTKPEVWLENLARLVALTRGNIADCRETRMRSQ